VESGHNTLTVERCYASAAVEYRRLSVCPVADLKSRIENKTGIKPMTRETRDPISKSKGQGQGQ